MKTNNPKTMPCTKCGGIGACDKSCKLCNGTGAIPFIYYYPEFVPSETGEEFDSSCWCVMWESYDNLDAIWGETEEAGRKSGGFKPYDTKREAQQVANRLNKYGMPEK